MTHRYPASAVVSDYLRAAVGLAVGVGILLSVPGTPAILAIFGGLTAIFLLFGLRTLQRHLTELTLDGEGISRRDLFSQTLLWRDLRLLKLRYFGTRRQHQQGSSGFMQLTLKGKGRRMKIESDIEGFEDIARKAAGAARSRGLALDPASASNFSALGIELQSE